MDITTNDDWTWVGDDYKVAFATTDDPRVVAVIERDDDSRTIAELFDGDLVDPMIYVEYRHGLSFNHQAGDDNGEAELMQRAYDTWGWNGTARRWLWIFHGIAAENAKGGYDRSGNWIVATSHAFREACGLEPHATYEEARKGCEAMAKELGCALDGDIFGVGYATNEARVMDDGFEIDPTDGSWTMSTVCWGFIGEEYAKREAATFGYESPDLPEMLVEDDIFGARKQMLEEN